MTVTVVADAAYDAAADRVYPPPPAPAPARPTPFFFIIRSSLSALPPLALPSARVIPVAGVPATAAATVAAAAAVTPPLFWPPSLLLLLFPASFFQRRVQPWLRYLRRLPRLRGFLQLLHN